MNGYKTIEKLATAEFVEKKSRFIGYIKPATTEEEAVDFINQIKSKHYDARHNVYAYMIKQGNIARYCDDGEPQGTAGIPILDVLKKNGLTDTAVVITRYFGGILLGGGGLVRAYSHTASLSVKAASVIQMLPCYDLKIVCDYSIYGKISTLILENNGKIDGTEFLENILIKFHMDLENFKIFEKNLTEVSSGKIICEKINENFYKF